MRFVPLRHSIFNYFQLGLQSFNMLCLSLTTFMGSRSKTKFVRVPTHQCQVETVQGRPWWGRRGTSAGLGVPWAADGTVSGATCEPAAGSSLTAHKNSPAHKHSNRTGQKNQLWVEVCPAVSAFHFIQILSYMHTYLQLPILYCMSNQKCVF